MGYYQATSEKMSRARETARAELERGYSQYTSNRQAQIARIEKLQAESAELIERAAAVRMGQDDPGAGYLKTSRSGGTTRTVPSTRATKPKGITDTDRDKLYASAMAALDLEGEARNRYLQDLTIAAQEIVNRTGLDADKAMLEINNALKRAATDTVNNIERNTGQTVQDKSQTVRSLTSQMQGFVGNNIDWNAIRAESPELQDAQQREQVTSSYQKQEMIPTEEKKRELERRKLDEFQAVLRAYNDDGVISPEEEAAWAETGDSRTLEQYAEDFMEDTFLQRVKLAGGMEARARGKSESAAAQQAAYDEAMVLSAPTEEQVAYRALQLYNPRGSIGYPQRRTPEAKVKGAAPKEPEQAPKQTGALKKMMENMSDGQRRQMKSLFGVARGRRAAKVAGLSEADAKRMVDQLEGVPRGQLIDTINNLASDYTYGDDKKARLVSDYLLSLVTEKQFKKEVSQAEPAPSLEEFEFGKVSPDEIEVTEEDIQFGEVSPDEIEVTEEDQEAMFLERVDPLPSRKTVYGASEDKPGGGVTEIYQGTPAQTAERRRRLAAGESIDPKDMAADWERTVAPSVPQDLSFVDDLMMRPTPSKTIPSALEEDQKAWEARNPRTQPSREKKVVPASAFEPEVIRANVPSSREKKRYTFEPEVIRADVPLTFGEVSPSEIERTREKKRYTFEPEVIRADDIVRAERPYFGEVSPSEAGRTREMTFTPEEEAEMLTFGEVSPSDYEVYRAPTKEFLNELYTQTMTGVILPEHRDQVQQFAANQIRKGLFTNDLEGGMTVEEHIDSIMDKAERRAAGRM